MWWRFRLIDTSVSTHPQPFPQKGRESLIREFFSEINSIGRKLIPLHLKGEARGRFEKGVWLSSDVVPNMVTKLRSF